MTSGNQKSHRKTLSKLLRTEISEIHSDQAMKSYEKIWLKMLYTMPIASANFTVQKQKLISQCQIQSEDLTKLNLIIFLIFRLLIKTKEFVQEEHSLS